MRWNRFTMAIGTLAIAFVLLVGATPVANVAGRAFSIEPDISPSGAIVVLASGLNVDGSLSEESQQRLLFGMRLYKEGLASVLVLSGPARPNIAPEAAVRARIAVEMGIPEKQIVQLINVNTTRDEAQQSARFLAPGGIKHILLVTESMHMRRSKAIFEAFGFKVSAAPSDNLPVTAVTPVDRMILCAKLLMHSVGLIYYHIAGYI